MIVDTSALLAYFDHGDRQHDRVRPIVEEASDELVVSPYVVAELDYVVATRLGQHVETTVLRELVSGAWTLAQFSADDMRTAIGVIERYGDQNIGLADASNVVLADRYSTRTIATFDRRDFEILRPLRGGRFSIVP